MTEELKPGDIVEFKDAKHKRLIEIISNDVISAKLGMSAMAESYRVSLEKLWEVVNEVHPELKGYEMSLDHNNLYIRIIGKKKPACEECGERLYPEYDGCIYCEYQKRKGENEDD